VKAIEFDWATQKRKTHSKKWQSQAKCEETRLLRYLKKTENRYRKKNTDNTNISIFFRDCILLNFMQNLLNIMPKFLFSNDAKQRRYMTHRVRDIFNKVWGHWPVINSLWNSALGIENAYYLLALITALDESCMSYCVIFLTGKLFRNILFNCKFETRKSYLTR
jgi:hypothetical protein